MPSPAHDASLLDASWSEGYISSILALSPAHDASLLGATWSEGYISSIQVPSPAHDASLLGATWSEGYIPSIQVQSPAHDTSLLGATWSQANMFKVLMGTLHQVEANMFKVLMGTLHQVEANMFKVLMGTLHQVEANMFKVLMGTLHQGQANTFTVLLGSLHQGQANRFKVLMGTLHQGEANTFKVLMGTLYQGHANTFKVLMGTLHHGKANTFKVLMGTFYQGQANTFKVLLGSFYRGQANTFKVLLGTFYQDQANMFKEVVIAGCLCAVTVSVPPKVEIEIGQETVLRCTPKFSGTPKYGVEWSFINQEGSRVRIATYNNGRTSVDQGTDFTERAAIKSDNSLVIKDIRVQDESTFYCRVTSTSEGSGEGSTELKVYVSPSAPELTVNLQLLSITEDIASEVGTCISRNSYPAPTIKWFRNQDPLNAGNEKGTDLYASSRTTTEASGLYTVSSTLFLKPRKEDADAVFSCKAVLPLPGGGTSEMESREFKLNLHYYTEAVTFMVEPVGPIKEGDKVTLRCEGDGNPQPTYLMQKIKDNKEEELESGSTGVHEFQNISRGDSGVYRCEALDFDSPDFIELMKQLELFVHYLNPVTVIPGEEEFKASLGTDVQLFCSCDGSEKPDLIWKKGDVVVSKSSRHRLKEVTYSNSGIYTCEADVPSVPGLHKEQSVTITVEGPPELDMENHQVEVESEGHPVTLSCKAKGNPVPKITWNQADLKASESFTNLEVLSEVSFKFSSKTMNNISCSAENHLGMKKKMFKLSMYEAPSVSPAQEQSGGSSTAIIAVVVCVLLLLLVVALFYFLQKKGKLACGRSEKQPLAQDPASAELAVELKSEKRNDQHGLLGRGGGGSAAEC
ncbi:PREDICTED: basal cell adhesion molecule [Nanorana parkeri]|uniref:basal cell adhesion molecule n=1 Tax=Nanorana parkeri TaxID=125878 RepID=UPI000854B0EF|nr:PREDICTED: basal cell adhesion molecule [Nanorana parkeri]